VKRSAEKDVTRRITRLEARFPADVMIWTPTVSASGNFEAMGDGWTIEEESPARFCELLEARLPGTSSQAPAE
jgi:hypothetical protein